MTSPSIAPRVTKPSAPALVIGALVVLALLAYFAKDSLYRGIVDASPVLSAAAVFFSEPALVILVAATAGIGVWAWFRHRETFWKLAAAAPGVVLAFGVSELVKSIFTE